MPPTSSSPPSSPHPLNELLALTQQLTPSKSPRTIRQQIQVQANDAQEECVNLKRRAVDAEQQADTTRKRRKTRKRGDRARDADDLEVNAQATETRIRDAGRYFAVQKAILLINEDIMNTEENEDFDVDHEFDSSENELQGQLRDILAVLPDHVKPKIKQLWVQDSFLDGLHSQRVSIRHRLRTEALHIIVKDVKVLATSASRFDAFSELIGYKRATETSEAFYDRFEVPILYDQWDGKIDLDHLCRGNRLLEVFASVIRGPRGAEGLFEGKSKLPQAKCLERIHKIVRITPGAIVSAAILVCSSYTLYGSSRRIPSSSRSETNIDYAFRHRIYIRRIREALRDKKAWAIGLLDYWNHILFPNSDKSRDHGADSNERLEDDEQLDDIFAQAPSAMERTVPQITSSPQANNDDQEQDWDHRRSSPTPPSPLQRSRSSSMSSQDPSPRSHPALSTRHAVPPRTTSRAPNNLLPAGPRQQPASLQWRADHRTSSPTPPSARQRSPRSSMSSQDPWAHSHAASSNRPAVPPRTTSHAPNTPLPVGPRQQLVSLQQSADHGGSRREWRGR
ncbi:hypothetical protein DFH07DRAFT_776677 [Mycena maculata]|uniref:Uncharacterized protein n=1 Tax=Mycena maculata TaxID=230809 RepID=A0AAD7INS0_9AGAR|nr:hypothetical protein DFH07DRAFT_776677 [Mycena maculata]